MALLGRVQGSRGGACFGCGSSEHQLSSCPGRVTQQPRQADAKVCYHCGEPGHFRPMCPQSASHWRLQWFIR